MILVYGIKIDDLKQILEANEIDVNNDIAFNIYPNQIEIIYRLFDEEIGDYKYNFDPEKIKSILKENNIKYEEV